MNPQILPTADRGMIPLGFAQTTRANGVCDIPQSDELLRNDAYRTHFEQILEVRFRSTQIEHNQSSHEPRVRKFRATVVVSPPRAGR